MRSERVQHVCVCVCWVCPQQSASRPVREENTGLLCFLSEQPQNSSLWCARLGVGYLVVLEQLLADVEEVGLDLQGEGAGQGGITSPG